MTTDQEFFDESTEQSQVKTAIVHDYFKEWARVILGVQKRQGTPSRLSYIDLFAGPGAYKDGRPSTPLLILQTAISDNTLSDSLVAVFNDKNKDNVESLQAAIANLPGIDKLKTQPALRNLEVGQQIVDALKTKTLLPTLLFVDPWGYKGLTLELLNAVLKDWGCDCIFFFNYNRINMGLANELVHEHMDALFGKTRADNLRSQLPLLKPREREERTLQEIRSALRESYGKFFLSFRFKYDVGTRTSHYLIFASKNFKGYNIMKHVMGKHSSTHIHGVPSFEYNPPIVRHQMLLDLINPIADLSTMLLQDLQGRTLSFKDLYEKHSVGRNFLRSNYQDALLSLEEKRVISAVPSERQKRNGRKTLADTVMLSFPSEATQ